MVVAALLRVMTPGSARPEPLTLNALRGAIVNRTLMANASLTILFSGIANLIYVFQAEIFIEQAGLSTSALAAALLCLGIGTMAGTWITGRAIDVFGPSVTLAGQAVVTACVALPMTLLHYGFAAACILAIIAGGSLFNHIPPLQMRLIRLMPESAGLIFSINASFVYAGSAIGSFVAGGMVDALGIAWLGPLAVLVAMSALACLWLLDRQKEIV